FETLGQSETEDMTSGCDYDTSRVPSFTDRVLYQSRLANGDTDMTDHSIRCINYQANQSLVSSDHKPVYALFEVILDSGGPRIPFRLKKLSQTVDGLKSKALSRENSLEFSSGTSNSVSRNITFFGRKLGR